MPPIKRLFRLLKPDRGTIFRIYFFAAFGGILSLILPLGIQAIINYISGGLVSTSLILLIALVIVAVIVVGITQVMQMQLIERLQQSIFLRSAFEFTLRIPRIKFEAISKVHAPELMNRFFDVVSLQKGLSKIFLDLSTASLQIFFGLVLLSFYHPVFILFGLISLLIIYLVFRLTGPHGLRTSLEESSYKYKVAYWLEELARTLNTFKLAGSTQLPVTKTNMLVEGYINSRNKHFRILLNQYGFIIAFKALVAGGLLIIGSMLVLESKINLGQFVAAEIIIILLLNSVEKLILSMEPFYDVLTSLEKIASVTDLELESEQGSNFRMSGNERSMKIQISDLSYDDLDTRKAILKNISLQIDPGDRVLIHGFSGSGKTTLMEIIGGLRDAYHGNISYNDLPASSLNVNSVRSFIGDSLSDEEIFEGTISENISLGKHWISNESMVWICSQIGLHDFIIQLSHGYETLLRPGGKGLPEYVIKKIKIARSAVDKLPLILWQENMQGLSQNEQDQLISFMTSKNNPWTLICESGSIKLAEQCDKIVLLQNGEIGFSGTLKQLKTQFPEHLNLFS